MSAEQPENQRRQSHRFVVSDAIQGELVLADRSRWPVRLLDQSAGGFSVVTDGSTPVSQGDTIQLQTDSFCSEVRVAYTKQMEHRKGDADPSVPRIRLGLQRMRDVAVPPDKDATDERWSTGHRSRPANQRSQILLLLGVIAIPILSILVVCTLLSIRSLRSTFVNSPTYEADLSEHSPSRLRIASDATDAPAGSSSTTPAGGAAVESRPEDLKYLPGATPFVTAGVIRDLQLSDAQLAKIRQILDYTDRLIAENEISRSLFESARQEVLDLLTDQQRQRWNAGNRAFNLRADEKPSRSPRK